MGRIMISLSPVAVLPDRRWLLLWRDTVNVFSSSNVKLGFVIELEASFSCRGAVAKLSAWGSTTSSWLGVRWKIHSFHSFLPANSFARAI